MEQSPCREADFRLADQKLLSLFITVFTRPHHWSLFWARWIHFTYFHPIFL